MRRNLLLFILPNSCIPGLSLIFSSDLYPHFPMILTAERKSLRFVGVELSQTSQTIPARPDAPCSCWSCRCVRLLLLTQPGRGLRQAGFRLRGSAGRPALCLDAEEGSSSRHTLCLSNAKN